MDNEIKITQGFIFRRLVQTVTTKLILLNDTEKHVVDNVIEEGGSLYLTATAEETATWSVGKYQYQLQDIDGIVEHGEAYVLVNFALDSADASYKSRWQIVLEAVDATLAGKATTAQQSVTIGDKSITSMNVTELLKLRDFIKARLAEEAKEKGEEYINPNDEKRIKFLWRRG